MQPTDTNDVKTIIHDLKHKKTQDRWNIHIIEPLTYISNKCIEHSIWSQAFINSKIIPIHKRSDKQLIDKRPISLVPDIFKNFVKLLKRPKLP